MPRSYQNYLRRARTENFQDMANLGAFYKAGLDYVGRQIVVFVGKHLSVSSLNPEKVTVVPLPPTLVLTCVQSAGQHTFVSVYNKRISVQISPYLACGLFSFQLKSKVFDISLCMRAF